MRLCTSLWALKFRQKIYVKSFTPILLFLFCFWHLYLQCKFCMNFNICLALLCAIGKKSIYMHLNVQYTILLLRFFEQRFNFGVFQQLLHNTLWEVHIIKLSVIEKRVTLHRLLHHRRHANCALSFCVVTTSVVVYANYVVVCSGICCHNDQSISQQLKLAQKSHFKWFLLNQR